MFQSALRRFDEKLIVLCGATFLVMAGQGIVSPVLPLYANTHTESSGTGLQTTRFREDARAIIKQCVGGGDEHALIFCGSGTTGAIDRLIGIMNLRIPADLDARYALSDHIPENERPVVFIGPYEHHSNELPWRESIADVVRIPEDSDGHIDLGVLTEQLTEREEIAGNVREAGLSEIDDPPAHRLSVDIGDEVAHHCGVTGCLIGISAGRL